MAYLMKKLEAIFGEATFLINGGGRPVEKEKAIKKVKNMYQINVSDDVAEAILIGKYRADLMEKKQRKDLF